MGARAGVVRGAVLLLVAAAAVAGSGAPAAVAAAAPMAAAPGAAAPGAAAAVAAAGRAWQWPLDGPRQVVRPFAPGPTRYSAGHYGADLGGRAGQPVRAAGAGRVSYAGLLAGRGVAVVDHGALRTTYEPVQASVRLGAQVARGAVLGTLAGGHACGAPTCLHLGLRRGDTYLDPLRLFGGPVRLLPAGGRGGEQRVAAPPAPVLVPPLPGAADGRSLVPPVARRGSSPRGAASEPVPLTAGTRAPVAQERPAPGGRAAPPDAGPPSWREQVARRPWTSAAAALALLAGLLLVRGPRPQRPSGGAAAGLVAGVPTAVAPPRPAPERVAAPVPSGRLPGADVGPSTVVLLDEERRRRRAG